MCIIDREEIPNSFKIVVKIPILKSNKKMHMFDDDREFNFVPIRSDPMLIFLTGNGLKGGSRHTMIPFTK